ncbi:Cytosolic Fe-S cluster assembly factor nar1 [Coemansia javaensis]|uniref:Cytosolic Fe-S cluster assembly factor NAR1 n=1 Tax=Coemansia javaensis TaxID=2761396 RepID=A0A9W8LEM6_9FUNG|nr:Cytosolic Fe-S cluster assembly factor nar1 [Coemansia javaensis]
MSFSGGLRLTDLNDYITPGQECIKPVPVKKTTAAAAAGGSQIRVGEAGDYYEVTKDGDEARLETAKITLNDCLACSGCVTSAETVLITMQSHHELVAVLEENRRLRAAGEGGRARRVVVTVAPQARASLAHKHGLSPLGVARRLTGALKAMGVDHVLDAAVGRDLTLAESAREFVRRFGEAEGRVGEGQRLPVLASWCPGWVCYAEKTHAEVLPWMSTTRSPQQAMGAVVKGYMAQRLGVAPDRIYHVAVMMCYDKKLEASRDDFYSDVYRTRDVDCVVTTGEVERMLAEQEMPLGAAPEAALDPMTKGDAARGVLYSSAGTSAGGGLEYVLSHAARALFGIDVAPEAVAAAGRGEAAHPLLRATAVRGQADHREVVLLDPATGQPRLRFAAVYGFRHLQNLVRKLKSGRAAYHYVEVAACPGACSNGGGQLQPADPSPAAKKQWVAETERAYAAAGPCQAPDDSAPLAELVRDWFGPAGLDSDAARAALHTQFRGVAAKANPLGVSW